MIKRLVLPDCLQLPLAGCVVAGILATAALEARRQIQRHHATAPASATATFVVDINRATWAELTVLPRFGETMSRRVIANRETHGDFQTVAELARVPGIGAQTVAQIAPYITLRSSASD